MATRTLSENINQTQSDFGTTKDAIIEKGVPVPNGTPTSGYGDLIRAISSGVTINAPTVWLTPDFTSVKGNLTYNVDAYKTGSWSGVAPTGATYDSSVTANGTYIAVASSTTPFIHIFKLSGNTYTKLSNPSTLPTGSAYGCSFSGDGSYLAVAHANSPYVTIYSRSGDTFTKLTNPSTPPTGQGNGCSFSYDGLYLAVAHSVTPFITMYSISGTIFTKLTNPTTLPASTGNDCRLDSSGSYLVVAHNTTPFISVYYRTSSTLTKLANPAILPTGSGTKCSITRSGGIIALITSSAPILYRIDGSGSTAILSRLTTPTNISTAVGCDLSYYGRYLVLGTSSYFYIYRRVGDVYININPGGTTTTGGYCAFNNNVDTSISDEGGILGIAGGQYPYISIHNKYSRTISTSPNVAISRGILLDNAAANTNVKAKYISLPQSDPIPNIRSLVFTDNGGSGGGVWDFAENVNVAIPTANELNITPPTLKIFSHWNTVSTGTGTTYNAGDSFSLISGITYLYAIWKTDPSVPITINVSSSDSTYGLIQINDKGFKTTDSINAYITNNITLSSQPTIEGRFVGWYNGDTLLSTASIYIITVGETTPTNITGRFSSLLEPIKLTVVTNDQSIGLIQINNRGWKTIDVLDIPAGTQSTLRVFEIHTEFGGFAGWYINNVLQTTALTYTLPPITDTLQVEARFTQAVPTLDYLEFFNCEQTPTFTTCTIPWEWGISGFLSFTNTTGYNIGQIYLTRSIFVEGYVADTETVALREEGKLTDFFITNGGAMPIVNGAQRDIIFNTFSPNQIPEVISTFEFIGTNQNGIVLFRFILNTLLT